MMKRNPQTGRIDWMITLVPLVLVITLCLLFFLLPEGSNTVVSQIRALLGDTMGIYYLAIGLGIFLVSLFLAFSPIGSAIPVFTGELKGDVGLSAAINSVAIVISIVIIGILLLAVSEEL